MTISHQLPADLSLYAPNHNPLIAKHQIDTFENLLAALNALQEISLFQSMEGNGPKENFGHGVYLFYRCVIDALEFELNHRSKTDRKILKEDSKTDTHKPHQG